MKVTLLSHTEDPIRSLYMAYRVAYSRMEPQDVLEKIESGSISREKMIAFIFERLKTGHSSPQEQVYFEFLISGVSRVFSHQFVRHRVGINFEQQSQRYVTYKDGDFPYVTPRTIENSQWKDVYNSYMNAISRMYDEMVNDGIPAEDARFILPNATATNFKVTVNFTQLLHMSDLRLCTRAQWEFRRAMALMRAEVVRAVPELGKYMQPKCGELRMGYCDESYKDWEACPIGRVRPHKDDLFTLYDQHRNGELDALREEDWKAIEDV